MRLAFAFDTYDRTDNAFEGWFIDDVTILQPGEANRDLFSFQLADGDTTTVVANSPDGGSLSVEILDGVGVPQALAARTDDLAGVANSFRPHRPAHIRSALRGKGNMCYW